MNLSVNQNYYIKFAILLFSTVSSIAVSEVASADSIDLSRCIEGYQGTAFNSQSEYRLHKAEQALQSTAYLSVQELAEQFENNSSNTQVGLSYKIIKASLGKSHEEMKKDTRSVSQVKSDAMSNSQTVEDIVQTYQTSSNPDAVDFFKSCVDVIRTENPRVLVDISGVREGVTPLVKLTYIKGSTPGAMPEIPAFFGVAQSSPIEISKDLRNGYSPLTPSTSVKLRDNTSVFLKIKKPANQAETLSLGFQGFEGRFVTFPSAQATHQDTLEEEINRILPIGSIINYAGNNLPYGFLSCDGSLLDSTINREYIPLLNAIGYTYGGVSSSGKFKIPDLRGRVALGAGQGANLTNRTLGQSIGTQETVALSVNELPRHSHPVSDPGHVHTTSNGDPAFPYDVYVPSGLRPQNRSGLTGSGSVGWNFASINMATTGISIKEVGNGQAFSIMQPSSVLKYAIKYK